MESLNYGDTTSERRARLSAESRSSWAATTATAPAGLSDLPMLIDGIVRNVRRGSGNSNKGSVSEVPKWIRSGIVSDPQINTEAANLGPAWARVAGECTECPTQCGPATRAPYLTGPTDEDRIDRIVYAIRFSDYGTDLLLQAEQWIYEREIARLGG